MRRRFEPIADVVMAVLLGLAAAEILCREILGIGPIGLLFLEMR